ncbi:terminase small subunit [Xanthomarina gelatinilytica]|uniref:terminase small subunit n=1 Tax=Xanthomarina gelatinilytica TaxID=1137281 RepID=UPI003AA99DE9
MTDKTFEKYKLVIDEYFINGFNGVKAYQKFYPKAKDKTADKRFRELTEIDRIKIYYSQRQEAAKKTLQTSHEVLLEELRNWAYSDITQTLMLTPEQVKELPEEVRRLITKYETTTRSYTVNETPVTETVVKLWFVSKERAMEMIHKHTGFYEKDNLQRTSIDYFLTLTPEERIARMNEIKSKLNTKK